MSEKQHVSKYSSPRFKICHDPNTSTGTIDKTIESSSEEKKSMKYSSELIESDESFKKIKTNIEENKFIQKIFMKPLRKSDDTMKELITNFEENSLQIEHFITQMEIKDKIRKNNDKDKDDCIEEAITSRGNTDRLRKYLAKEKEFTASIIKLENECQINERKIKDLDYKNIRLQKEISVTNAYIESVKKDMKNNETIIETSAREIALLREENLSLKRTETENKHLVEENNMLKLKIDQTRFNQIMRLISYIKPFIFAGMGVSTLVLLQYINPDLQYDKMRMISLFLTYKMKYDQHDIMNELS